MRFSSYRFNGGFTRNSTRFCGSKPTSTWRRFWSVPQKQARADQQHERDGDLHDEQRLAEEAARAHHAAAGLLERRADVHSRPAQRRRDAEDDAREAGDGEDERPARASRAASAWPGGAGQQLPAPVADENPERAADRRQQQALGEQLPDQRRARRADREPHRDLFLPRRRARQQQVGDVRADDQQHEGDDDAENRDARSSFVLTS